jgi:hypothetical protein
MKRVIGHAIFVIALAAFPLSALIAFFYCLSHDFFSCEHKPHASSETQGQKVHPEVALSLILLADEEHGKGTKTEERPSQTVEPCPIPCRIVTKTLHDPTALFTAVLAFVVWLQFIWLARQEIVLSKSLAVAEKSANALINAERAHLIFENLRITDARDQSSPLYPDNDGVVFRGEYKNHGRSPARLTTGWIATATADTPLGCEQLKEDTSRWVQPQPIPPNTGIPFAITIAGSEWEDIDYMNLIFEERLHTSGFAYHYVNRTDEDGGPFEPVCIETHWPHT